MLAAPLAALSGAAVPTVPGISTGTLFSGGIPMGKLPLQILTAFPATGYLGLNLSAAGMPIAAMVKGGVYAAGIGLSLLVAPLYLTTATNVLFYIMTFAPPWYIFDCIQIIFDGAFDTNGFLLPLPVPGIPTGGAVGGNWVLTFPLVSLILAAISAAGGALLLKYLPQSLVDSGGKYAQYATVGGGVGLAVIGLIATSLMKSAPAQAGGGMLPPLSSFLKQFKSSSGTPHSESIAFLGLLALIVVGGGSLGYLRSKSDST